jgi:hypothetical protein
MTHAFPGRVNGLLKMRKQRIGCMAMEIQFFGSMDQVSIPPFITGTVADSLRWQRQDILEVNAHSAALTINLTFV